MRIHAAVSYAIVGMTIALAGCQEQQLVAPPPTFEPPMVEADMVVLPTTEPAATQPATTQSTQPSVLIQEVNADELINSAALRPAVSPRPWKYIIVHHSDTEAGSALRFHKAHLANLWDMLGYDFVIGNGTETRDGLIEVGPRWTQQLTGAHTKTPDHIYNDFGIGICLVGNFEESWPTAKQLDALARLCAYMMKTYDIPPDRIIGHRDAKSTKCPGRNLSIPKVRELAEQYLQQMQ